MIPGTRLGPYEVLAALGAGGMGEVYRARDTKLNREVAIKVLPPAFGQDSERLARFQREAQTLAALNHPNIAQVFGMEENALVMEYVPGDSPRGPMPVDEAMQIARQIGEALEAAHEKGIVHRDLKPANIKVTPDGKVKVLDFGLAKAMAEAPADLSNSPTLSIAATKAGMILGTASYMSPEQAKGKPVDARTDIWAYGCVLYELLTGKQAFPGETAIDAMAAIISREPDWSLLPAGSPVELLRACLQKDVSKRLRHIGDSSLVGMSSTVFQAPATVATARRSALPWIAAVAALAVTSALGWVAWYRATRPAPLRPLIRLSAELGQGTALARVRNNGILAISPDGTRLAVTYRGADGKNRLGTRLLNRSQVTPLTGTEDAATPFFSPDSQWIGFHADGKLKKVAVDGGAAVTICESSGLRGANWGDDGNIVFAPTNASPLMRVSSSGGTPALLTKLAEGERTHRWPQVLPGSQAVLFTSAGNVGGYDDANIEVLSLKTGQTKVLRRGGFSPRFLPTIHPRSGHIVYIHESTMFAAPFDLDSLSITGEPAPVLEDAPSNPTGGGDFDFSQSGTLIYPSGGASRARWQMQWLDSSGKRQAVQANPDQYLEPRVSPDGKRLAYTLATGQSGGTNIWVQDLERDTPSRLTFLTGRIGYPVWTPDGRAIIFKSEDAAKPGLCWVRSDGSGEAVRLTDGKFNDFPESISPDGKHLAFHRVPVTGPLSIYTAVLEGDAAHPRLGKEEPFLANQFADFSPSFSPDGRWIAYVSNESGINEVYVRSFPGPGGRWQVSTGGGMQPRWSRDGKELRFEKPDGTIMAAGYTARGDTFAPGVPKVWSTVPLLSQGLNYDLAADGKRIVGLFPLDDPEGQRPMMHITFLLNFFDELKRKARN